MLRVLLALSAVGTAGCGPIEYVSTVTFQADRALAQAKSANAEKLAPYEYTLAREELHKARELGGFSRFQEAVDFGRSALKHGREAESLALERALHGAGRLRRAESNE